jgi:hypothetical protein
VALRTFEKLTVLMMDDDDSVSVNAQLRTGDCLAVSEPKQLSNKERRNLKRQQQNVQDVPRKTLKKQKIFKEIVTSSLAASLSSRKLLILDVNKVLVYRKNKCSTYFPRPFVVEFLKEMSTHFKLAIWTSMKKSSARKLMCNLFRSEGIKLLFVWFQSRCVTVPAEDPEVKPTFYKNLQDVWTAYPSYNLNNTVSR